MKYLWMMLFSTIVLVGADGLAAQQISSPYRYIEETQELGAFAGYLWTSSPDPDLGPRSAPILGLRYNLRFTGPLAGEASIGFAPSERTVFSNLAAETDSVPNLREEGTTDMPLLLAEAGLRFTLTGARTWNSLAPYVVATGGLAADLGGDSDFELDDDERLDFGPGFAVGLGAGTTWFPSRRLSLRVEVRDQIWRITTPPGLLGQGDDDSRWTNNIGVTIGAAFHF